MAVLVTLLGVVIAILGVLVAGLLRSHAEILRALHDMRAELDLGRQRTAEAPRPPEPRP
jgi:hypothetical protein